MSPGAQRLLPRSLGPARPPIQGFVPNDPEARARIARRRLLRSTAPMVWSSISHPLMGAPVVSIGILQPADALHAAADSLGWPEEGRVVERRPAVDPHATVLVAAPPAAEPLPGRMRLDRGRIVIDLIDPTTGEYP